MLSRRHLSHAPSLSVPHTLITGVVARVLKASESMLNAECQTWQEEEEDSSMHGACVAAISARSKSDRASCPPQLSAWSSQKNVIEKEDETHWKHTRNATVMSNMRHTHVGKKIHNLAWSFES
jgi:hypothetical protein